MATTATITITSTQPKVIKNQNQRKRLGKKKELSSSLLPIVVMRISLTDDELGLKSVLNDTAIVRLFTKKNLKFEQPIIDSSCTYWGMSEILEKMHDWNIKHNLSDSDKLCVLCPIYKYGDTQAGGGGKLTISKLGNERKYETYYCACKEEIAEELRISVPDNAFHVSKMIVQSPSPQKKNTITNIFQYKINECCPIKPFDSLIYGKKHRRGFDVNTKRVAFIVSGKYMDCMSLISKITRSNSHDPLIDGIHGVSIVSLKKAISMARNASKNLSGIVQNSWNIYDTYPM
jgi:hypothetical protein